MTEHEQKVMQLVSEAAVYVPFNCEGMRVDYWDSDEQDEDYQGCFYGTGEETGEQYKVTFAEVDLEMDSFYKLVPMN